MYKNRIPLLILTILIVGIVSCSKFSDLSDAEVVTDDGEFAIPLASATTSFQDIIDNFDENTFVTIDPDGLIRLQYKGDVATRTAEEIMADARNSIPTNFIPIIDTVFALPFSSPEELEVDYAQLKGTKIILAIQDDLHESIELKVRLPEVFNEDQTEFWEFDTTFVGAIDYASSPFSVAGDLLIPKDGTIFVEYEAYNETGERVKLDFISLFIQDLDFSYVEGYLGIREHNGDRDTIEIDFFENWIDGEINFVDPKIRINLVNSFGIPTRSVIRVFDVYTADGINIPLDAEELNIADNQGIDFFFPSLDQIGESTVQTFVFDSTNSNIKEVLSSRPIALDYDVDAKTNPDELVDVRGFLTDSSFYKVQVEVELPLYGSARNFLTTDTFEIDLSDYDEIVEAEFKIVADNGAPLDVETQMYFIDTLGLVIDSLLPQKEIIVAAAPVDNNGITINRNENITFIDFPAERIEGVREAKKLILEAGFSTAHGGNSPVRVFSDQDVIIKIGLRFKQE